jgi:hypothetical protein
MSSDCVRKEAGRRETKDGFLTECVVDMFEQVVGFGGFGLDEPGGAPSDLPVAVVTALSGTRTLIAKGATYFDNEDLITKPFKSFTIRAKATYSCFTHELIYV